MQVFVISNIIYAQDAEIDATSNTQTDQQTVNPDAELNQLANQIKFTFNKHDGSDPSIYSYYANLEGKAGIWTNGFMGCYKKDIDNGFLCLSVDKDKEGNLLCSTFSITTDDYTRDIPDDNNDPTIPIQPNFINTNIGSETNDPCSSLSNDVIGDDSWNNRLEFIYSNLIPGYRIGYPISLDDLKDNYKSIVSSKISGDDKEAIKNINDKNLHAMNIGVRIPLFSDVAGHNDSCKIKLIGLNDSMKSLSEYCSVLKQNIETEEINSFCDNINESCVKVKSSDNATEKWQYTFPVTNNIVQSVSNQSDFFTSNSSSIKLYLLFETAQGYFCEIEGIIFNESVEFSYLNCTKGTFNIETNILIREIDKTNKMMLEYLKFM